MSINEAYSMLLTHEARLEANQLSASKEAKLNYAANVAQTEPNYKPGGQYNTNWNKNVSTGGRGGYGRGFSPQGQGRENWNGIQSGRGAYNASNGNFGGYGISNFGGYSTGNFSGYGTGNGNFGKTGGFNNGKRIMDPNTAAMVCQICFKSKHTAVDCRNRFNRDFIPFYPPSSYHQLQAPRAPYQNSAPKAAFMATSEGDMADQGWYIDSGATHHLTNNLQNLTLGKEYSGQKEGCASGSRDC